MLFTKKKLPLEKVADLIPYEISETVDYRILGSPVYLLMKKNGKLVSVKEPLDFFTMEELMRVSVFGSQLFVSPLLKESAYFYDKGRAIREILGWLTDGAGPRLEPAPYEVSLNLRMKLNQVWSKHQRDSEILFGVESFFLPFLVEGVCGPLPKEMWIETRTTDFGQYEIALLQSSLLTFFLLHLSVLEEKALQAIRLDSFLQIYEGNAPKPGRWSPEVLTLFRWIQTKFPDSESRLLTNEDLHVCHEQALQKISSRVKNFSDLQLTTPISVHGVNGFLETTFLVGIKDSEVTRTLSTEFLEVKRVA